MRRGIYKAPDAKAAFWAPLEKYVLVIVYHCETTGLSPVADHIIQLSARKCFISEDGLEEAERRDWHINPGYPLPEQIVRLTGITDEFLSDKPTEWEVAEEIISFFRDAPVVGYNNDKFGNQFLQQLFLRHGSVFSPEGSIDLYAVIKDVIDPGETRDRKLQTITEHFGLSGEIAMPHGAEGDTAAIILCFNQCIGLCRDKQNEGHGDPIPCVVKRVSRWNNPRDWKQQRVYVETDRVTVWFDVWSHIWSTKYAKDPIGQYSMGDIIRQALSLTGCENEDALAKFNGKVTNTALDIVI